jgi:hypothetical protein
MINTDGLFFLQASFLITLSLIVSSCIFLVCLRYGANWAGLNAPDSLLHKLYKKTS